MYFDIPLMITCVYLYINLFCLVCSLHNSHHLQQFFHSFRFFQYFFVFFLFRLPFSFSLIPLPIFSIITAHHLLMLQTAGQETRKKEQHTNNKKKLTVFFLSKYKLKHDYIYLFYIVLLQTNCVWSRYLKLIQLKRNEYMQAFILWSVGFYCFFLLLLNS